MVGTGVDPVTSRFSGGPTHISGRLGGLGIRGKDAGHRLFRGLAGRPPVTAIRRYFPVLLARIWHDQTLKVTSGYG